MNSLTDCEIARVLHVRLHDEVVYQVVLYWMCSDAAQVYNWKASTMSQCEDRNINYLLVPYSVTINSKSQRL